MAPLARRWPLLLSLFVLAVPAGAAAAGDGPGASDRERVVAAVLEAASLRMRAKIDESGILDGQGRHGEAIAALESVEGIHRDALALVDRLLATLEAAPAVAATVRGGRSPSVRSLPLPPTPPPPAPPVPSRAFPGATAHLAASYLMSAQRIDGWFRPGPAAEAAPGADLDDGHEMHATAMSVLALLDTIEDAAEPSRAVSAATLGVQALLSSQGESGAFGDGKDLEAHALASWAVASGLSRMAKAPWRDAARRGVSRAIGFALSRRDERGLWRAGGSAADDWILSAWMVVFLHEALPMKGVLAPGLDLEAEIARARDGAGRAAADLEGQSPAARFAWALLAPVRTNQGVVEAPPILPTKVEGETAVLLGTTYRFGRSQGFDAWAAEVLEPEQRRQVRDGRLAGSWDPVGERAKAHGRTYATACQLLASLIPEVPFREPAGD